jgi:cytochrome d ubiquinol oxidase subunit I
MVGIGVVMLVLVVWGLVAWRRGRLADSRTFHRVCMLASPLGFVAVIAGWVTTEVGRQPWVVYGLMRTRDAVTPSLQTHDVVMSLVVYVVAYLVIFGSGVYFLVRLAKRGFAAAEPGAQPFASPARPLSGATRAT